MKSAVVNDQSMVTGSFDLLYLTLRYYYLSTVWYIISNFAHLSVLVRGYTVR